MKKILKVIIWCPIIVLFSCNTNKPALDEISISKAELSDKVKGGWAGQVIGCTYGGPTEFRWNGTMIDDYVPIHWDDERML